MPPRPRDRPAYNRMSSTGSCRMFKRATRPDISRYVAPRLYCHVCGYPLLHSQSARCSECGHAATPHVLAGLSVQPHMLIDRSRKLHIRQSFLGLVVIPLAATLAIPPASVAHGLVAAGLLLIATPLWLWSIWTQVRWALCFSQLLSRLWITTAYAMTSLLKGGIAVCIVFSLIYTSGWLGGPDESFWFFVLQLSIVASQFAEAVVLLRSGEQLADPKRCVVIRSLTAMPRYWIAIAPFAPCFLGTIGIGLFWIIAAIHAALLSFANFVAWRGYSVMSDCSFAIEVDDDSRS